MILALILAAAIHPGVERWFVKTHATVHAPRVTQLVLLEALPDVPGVTHNDARYQARLIPTGMSDLREGATVVTTGVLRLVAAETDGDYHVQLATDATTQRCLIVECPRPAYTAANIRSRCAAARATLKKLAGREPSTAGTLTRPARVRVTGQLFYDDAHVGDAPRGKRGMRATTLWEVHPVWEVEAL